MPMTDMLANGLDRTQMLVTERMLTQEVTVDGAPLRLPRRLKLLVKEVLVGVRTRPQLRKLLLLLLRLLMPGTVVVAGKMYL